MCISQFWYCTDGAKGPPLSRRRFIQSFLKMSDKILQEIRNADGEKAKLFLKALIQRYAELYPDWEVSTFSVRKTEDRNSQIDEMIRFLQSIKV